MEKSTIKLWSLLLLTFGSISASAVPINFSQYSLFLSSDGETYQDDQLGVYSPIFAPKVNNFGSAGIGVVFNNNLTTSNLGSVSWTLTNNSGVDLSSGKLFGFLDADIDSNAYWNEYAGTYGDIGNSYDYWEIDEPGYEFGDIYNNLRNGNLDQTNSVPVDSPEDVSLGLGFDFSNWLAGSSLELTFSISEAARATGAGLFQTDSETGDTFYFEGSIKPVSVPEPSTLLLLSLGLVFLGLSRRTLNS